MADILNVNVLVSAKEEYTSQLCYVLSPLIYQGIVATCEDSKKLEKKVRGFSVNNFKICLANIQNWSSFTLEKETKRIKKYCPYLNDLVTAIFVSHVKILASVRLKGNNKNIKLKIPAMDLFIHKVYILVAERFYNNPHLIDDSEQNNIELISKIIDECIRKQLPIEHILNEYLADVFNSEDTESESEKGEEEKELKGEEFLEENESDNESEYTPESKNIPTIPINSQIHNNNDELPNFEDVTKIDINNTPILSATEGQEITEQLLDYSSPQQSPQQSPQMSPQQSPQMSPQQSPQMSPQQSPQQSPYSSPQMSRPQSPITLFNDASEY